MLAVIYLAFLPLLDIPSNMGGMPLPSASDIVAAMWAVMGPFGPYITVILGLVLALGVVRVVFGLLS
jgi:hypothetical protein